MRPIGLSGSIAALVVVVALAACSANTTPTPSASVDVPSSAEPSTVAPTPSPDPSEQPSTTPAATPAATPIPTMSADEQALIAELRSDMAVDCVPRRADLPEGARYGIECDPGIPLVQRVGVYRFDSPNDAAFAYMTRMAAAGVDVNSGDCQADRAGEGAYVPGDNEGGIDDPGVFNWENSALMSERNGCFVDDAGNANVRLVCDKDYIGILGAKDDLSDLLEWAWTYPDGYEPGTPDLPGACIGTVD